MHRPPTSEVALLPAATHTAPVAAADDGPKTETETKEERALNFFNPG